MPLNKSLIAAASMLAIASSASAMVVNFTNVESPGVSCCGLMASNAYAAFGLTVNDAYWYADGRDTFDGQGISIFTAPTATIIFNGGSNGVGFQYVVLRGSRGLFEAWDSSSNSLGQLAVDASNTGDLLGTHAFAGMVDRLTYTGLQGVIGVSAVEFTGVVPEPSTYALMALGLAGIGAIARRRKA
ncbi:MAG: PEP-CTERM sorting domain-containing protein [Aquabacterium sp.]